TGQGKWYPGEELPRWKLATYWRTDGQPLWRNQTLLADPAKDYGSDLAEARRFAERLCEMLKLEPKNVRPGYEDVFYFLWEEGKLPANADPLTADLKEPAERRRLAHLLERDLGLPSGYALPLRWSYSDQRWGSAPWQFSRGHMFLIPGD